MNFAKSKAFKIYNKSQPRINANSPSYKTSPPHTFITSPNNSSSNIIINNLNKHDIKNAFYPLNDPQFTTLYTTSFQMPVFIILLVGAVN